jgi:hypothetical protein
MEQPLYLHYGMDFIRSSLERGAIVF